MLTVSVLAALLLTTSVVAKPPSNPLSKRDATEACTDLTIDSNNGDRKIAIVIDSSGSMLSSDPSNLRLAAARALNDFLVSNGEAGGGRSADQVAVVGFASSSYTVFGPGDPGDPAANTAISKIDASGGTYIASGVHEAIGHISKMNGATKDRSAIVVFTDGEDSDTTELVSAINNATSLGIRVSFGYLDTGSTQPDAVLRALRNSKGVYATIAYAAGSQNFVNYVLLNGLTYQDNPQGAGDRLLAGLATTQFISGPNAVALKYGAEQGEVANFTIVSFTGDRLSVEAKMGRQTLYASPRTISSRQFFEVTAPNAGMLDLFVTASDSPKDGLFSVLTNSNQPIKNCTVGVSGGNKGLSSGAKAGIGIGVVAAVLGAAGIGFWTYKQFLGGGNTTAPAPGADTAPMGGEGDQASYPMGAEKPHPLTDVAPTPAQGGNFPMQSPPAPNGFGNMPLSGMEGNATSAPTAGGFESAPLSHMLPAGSPGGGSIPLSGMEGYATSAPTAGGFEGVHLSDVAPAAASGGHGWAPQGTLLPPMMPPMQSMNNQHASDTPPNHPNSPYNSTQKPLSPPGSYQPTIDKPEANIYQQPLGSSGPGAYQSPMATPLPGSDAFSQSTPLYNANPNSTAPTLGSFDSNSEPKTGQWSHQYYHDHPNQQPLDQHEPVSPLPTPTPSPGPETAPTPGSGSGSAPAPGPSGIPPPTHNQAGFPVPGPPSTWRQQPAEDEEKHHHHPWLPPDMACEQPECPLHLPPHDRCLVGGRGEGCECWCLDVVCPVRRGVGRAW